MKGTDLNNIARELLVVLNEEGKDIVKGVSLNSPRAVGDAVQAFIGSEKGLARILRDQGVTVEDDFTRRSMEDLAFKDLSGKYYAVDVKTHNLDTNFNMPNLISVKRLAQFYKRDDNNVFCILIVSYNVEDGCLAYKECYFKPIEAFSWDCLTLGALGWGQIQIANANTLHFYGSHDVNRRRWMIELCDNLQMFYDEEISKIGERKTWFKETKQYWIEKSEVLQEQR